MAGVRNEVGDREYGVWNDFLVAPPLTFASPATSSAARRTCLTPYV